MSSRVPGFLLGGINLTYSFLGSRTALTGAYGASETALKLLPVIFVFGASVKPSTRINLVDTLKTEEEAAPERRSTLTQ